MEETTTLDANYLHQLFCELMGCEQIDSHNLRVFSMNEDAYIDKLQQEEIPFDENNLVSSSYKEKDNGKIEIYVNEDALNDNPIYVTDIFYSQLFDLYCTYIPYYQNANMLVYRVKWLKKVQEGFKIWFDFNSVFLSSKLTKNLYGDFEYTADIFETIEEDMLDVLSNLKDADETKEDKMSVLIYTLAKLDIFEQAIDSEPSSLSQLKRIKTRDISSLIEGELGQDIYKFNNLLVQSVLGNINVILFIKLKTLYDKISSNL